MNVVILLVLLSVLFTSLFVIIPKYAPADTQEIIKDWLGLGFNGVILILALLQTKFNDPTMITPVLFYLVILAFCLSGVYWWIPTFLKKEEQSDAIKYMFLSTTGAILIVNNLSPSIVVTPYSGGRRR